MPGGTEIPVVRRLRPAPIRRDGPCAVRLRVLNCLGQDGLRSTGSVVVENGQCADSKAAVADTVPVTIDVLRPPAGVAVVGVVVRDKTPTKTVVDEGRPDLALLLVGEDIVEPVVCVTKGSAELSRVEEVGGVPLVCPVGAKRRGAVSGSILGDVS